MKIGIHPDKTAQESYSETFTNYFLEKGIEVQPLNLLAGDALDQAKDCDGIIWRWLHRPQDKQSAQQILYTIEHLLDIPVFPNSTTAWHYDNKIAQHYLLSALQAPYVRTWIFWHYKDAVNWIEQANFPLVFKLSAGAGSANVVKVENKKQAKEIAYKMFSKGIFSYTHNEYKQRLNWVKNRSVVKQHLKNVFNLMVKNEYPPLNRVWWKPEFGYVYFQEFLPNNEYDTRVTVIGNRAFAFRRFNRPGDFRASGSGRLDTSPHKIDLECVKIAFDISKKANFQSMAYDFIYNTKKQPLVGEVSYTFSNKAVHQCPGYWDENLDWIEGHLWPEEAIAEDFLERIKAK